MKPLQNSYSDLNLNPLLISENLTMYMWLICPTVCADSQQFARLYLPSGADPRCYRCGATRVFPILSLFT